MPINMRRIVGAVVTVLAVVMCAATVLPIFLMDSADRVCLYRPWPDDIEFRHEGYLPDGEYSLWPLGVRCSYPSSLEPGQVLVVDEPSWTSTFVLLGGSTGIGIGIALL